MAEQIVAPSHVAPKKPAQPEAGDLSMSREEYAELIFEIDNQPLRWRSIADKECDYADGNQLDSELLKAQQALGIPPAMENLIGPAMEAIQGYEVSTRTDWRVTPSGQPEGRDVAEAISFRLNQAERTSKADRACSEAFRTQISVGIGWVEAMRGSDPFGPAYQCSVVHRNEIHWDMSSGSTDPSVWRWLRRQRWLRPERLKQFFPDSADLLEQYACAGATWWADGTFEQFGGLSTSLRNSWNEARESTIQENRFYNPATKEVCLAEVWYRRWVQVGIIETPDGRKVEYDGNNRAHTLALAQGLAKYTRAVVPRVRRAYWLGPHCLSDEPTPYTHRHFPYVPFFGFMEDSTKVPFGFVRSLIFQQDTLNSGTAKLRWGMSAFRTERTKNAVAMSDAVFRRTVGRLDADIVLDPVEMAKPGARFEVKRDFELTQHQLQMLDNARMAIQRAAPAAAAAFSGRPGTARSGVQEETQVEQANQGLAWMMQQFRDARTMLGELLMAMIVEDMGSEQHVVVIEGDAVTPDREVVINKPERDEAGYLYLSNDLQRTQLMVVLDDVPSSKGFRTQQLNAMTEAVKSLPQKYQAAALPFMVSLMDTPFKRELIEAIRAADKQQDPMVELKARELDIKERESDARIKQLIAQAVQTGVEAAFSAMQAGAQVVMNPMIAPAADAIMKASGYQTPVPAGVDPNLVGPDGALPAVAAAVPAQPAAPAGQPPQGDIAAVRRNTSPAFPPVPQDPGQGLSGVETPSLEDNLPS